ncbi:hypothetical protein HII31_08256 [Pseudocercospora fuligena]|uniref:Uncharacterized protein n=1 Tax=Pseudocercospora fuligena TaxID=685502 RepID=A0A8H6RGC9_9PEZI|nr:hypothetical protein HII31_08256 [Pseudocercospora fuligena]
MADYQFYQAKTAELDELKNEILAVEDAIRAILASESALNHEENGFLDRLRNKRVLLYAQHDLSNVEALLIWCQVGAANGTLTEEYASKIPSWEANRRICKGRLIFARAQRQVLMAATMPPVPEDITVFSARLLEATTPVLEEGETAENPIVLEDSESSRTWRDDSEEREWETVSQEDSETAGFHPAHTTRSYSFETRSEAGYDADSESGGDEIESLLSSVEDAEEYDDEESDEEENFEPQKRTCMIYNRRIGEWQRY